MPQQQFPLAMITGHYRCRCALILRRMAGDDIDDAEEGVGTVGDRVGAANDFYALDVIDGQRQIIPVHAANGRRVNGPPIDQHLQGTRKAVRQAVIGDHWPVAAGVSHIEAGRQPQQVGNVAKTGEADEFTIDYSGGSGRVGQRLGQTRHGQDDGQIGQKCVFRKRQRGPLLGRGGKTPECRQQGSTTAQSRGGWS